MHAAHAHDDHARDHDRKVLYVNDQPVQSHEHLLRTFFGTHGAARLRSGFRMQPCGGISTVEYDDGVEGLAAYCGPYFPRAWGAEYEPTEALLRDNGEGRIPKPPDLQVTVLCTLEQLFSGVDRFVRIIRCVTRSDGVIVREMFERCVSVKAGCRAGMRIRVKGGGNRIAGCIDGDVVFTIAEKTHPKFVRHGDNLSVSHSITLAQALTRSVVSITGIDGKPVNVDVWAVFSRQFSWKHGVNVLVRGAGMPAFEDASFRGDLIVNFDVIYPPESCIVSGEDQCTSTQFVHSSSFSSYRDDRRAAHGRDIQCSSFARLRRALRLVNRSTPSSVWYNIFDRQVCSSLRIEATDDDGSERMRTRSDWGYGSWGGTLSELFVMERLRMMMMGHERSRRDFSESRSEAASGARPRRTTSRGEHSTSARRDSSRRRSRRFRWVHSVMRGVVFGAWRRQKRRPRSDAG
ncbi:chaperone protein DnaJ [Gracilaria domingensis]|nr:chaperone protein DnaJ [Gracilaria domingensis]